MSCNTHDKRLRFVLSPGQTIEGRFTVKLISRQAFAQYMSHRGMSVRDLADRAGVSRSLIGHLRSGKRSTCKDESATKIERALDAPHGSLFVGQMSHVLRDNGRAA